jgi:hypothetical protein
MLGDVCLTVAEGSLQVTHAGLVVTQEIQDSLPGRVHKGLEKPDLRVFGFHIRHFEY